MKAVASLFGKETLRGLTERDILSRIEDIRERIGDRAALRAIHFIRENERVNIAKDALLAKDTDVFLNAVSGSGNSSFKYLQNVYTNLNVKEQGLSLALALADGYLNGRSGACRVHGGGFAGTVQVFVKTEELSGLVSLMASVFGEDSVMTLNIRPMGAIKLDFD
jgi:galactokinase